MDDELLDLFADVHLDLHTFYCLKARKSKKKTNESKIFQNKKSYEIINAHPRDVHGKMKKRK